MSTTITGLPNATTPLDGTERVPMDQAGATKDATTQAIADLAPGTDLNYNPSTRLLSSSTGADVTFPLVGADAGLMAAADKAKLDGIAEGAEANVNADWTASSGDAAILNKPTLGTAAAAATTDFATAAQGALADSAVQPGDLATVATSGAYSDLSGTPGVVSSSTAGLQPASGYGTISYAAQVTLDFATLAGQMNSISLTGNLELLTSNLANAREVRLRLVCDATQRTLTFPTDWRFVGTKPATIAASKVAVLSLAAFGATNADVVAAYAVQS